LPSHNNKRRTQSLSALHNNTSKDPQSPSKV
jgi:hypothetical protein